LSQRERARLYATTLPGLEAVLAEELVGTSGAQAVDAGHGSVVFEHPVPVPLPAPFLACDSLSLLVRDARGDFTGANGLSAVCGRLARTQFDRSLDLLSRLTKSPPRTFTVAATVASDCGFLFFDAAHRALPVLANRLDLPASDREPDLVIDLHCLPDLLRIGVRLPLQSWPRPTRKSPDSIPRSLVGSLIRLAGPNRAATLCDPDCASGEIIAAWQSVVGARHVVGLEFRNLSPQPLVAARRVVRASSRTWPIADGRLSRVVSALPFVRAPAEFAKLLGETERCLASGGRAAFAIPGEDVFDSGIRARPRLKLQREVRFREGKQARRIVVLAPERTARSHRTDLTAGDRARATSALGGLKSGQRRRSRRPRRPAAKGRSRPRR
jgi:hypothetical protein